MTAATRLTLLSLSTTPWLAAADPEASPHPHHHHQTPPENSSPFHFHPHLNAAIALGGSSSEKNLALPIGSHSPLDDGFNLQGLEIGAALEYLDTFSLHANHNLFWDRFDGWDGEWEEAFAVLHLPANLTLRAGQYLVPFGHENDLHLHERQFAEAPLSMIRLLGEEGLIQQGLEISLPLDPDQRWTFHLGYGQARSHSHGARREAQRETAYEELFGEHEEDPLDPDHHDEHHHSHGLAGNGGRYDSEEAFLDDGFFTSRLRFSPARPSLISHTGLSFAGGRNGFGRYSFIAGADLGGSFELASRPASWNAETFFRNAQAYDEDQHAGSYQEHGALASLIWEFHQDWTLGGRLEWASGNRESGNERRWRISTHLGRSFEIIENVDLHTRLQYSYDRLGGYADEHTVWLQFILNAGSSHHSHTH